MAESIAAYQWRCRSAACLLAKKSLSSPEIFFIQEKQPAIDFCSGSCIAFGLVIFEPIYESLKSY